MDRRIKPETSSACATHSYSVFNIPDLQDKAVKERVDARNKLETYLYNMKSTAEDKMKDKVRRPGSSTCIAGYCYGVTCKLMFWVMLTQLCLSLMARSPNGCVCMHRTHPLHEQSRYRMLWTLVHTHACTLVCKHTYKLVHALDTRTYTHVRTRTLTHIHKLVHAHNVTCRSVRRTRRLWPTQ